MKRKILSKFIGKLKYSYYMVKSPSGWNNKVYSPIGILAIDDHLHKPELNLRIRHSLLIREGRWIEDRSDLQVLLTNLRIWHKLKHSICISRSNMIVVNGRFNIMCNADKNNNAFWDFITSNGVTLV